MELTQILVSCTSAEVQVRTQAEAQLAQALEQHPGEFFKLLVRELQDDSKPENARTLAGLQLKNALYGKSKATNSAAQKRWLAQPQDVKIEVREKLVQSLEAKADVGRKYAALVFGKLAAIEIPSKEWPAMLEVLLSRVTETDKYAGSTRRAAITTLGFISEEMTILADDGTFTLENNDSTSILAAIVQGRFAKMILDVV